MVTKRQITFNIGWEIESIRELPVKDLPKGVFAQHDGSVNGDSMEYCLATDMVGDNPRAMYLLRKVVTNPFMLVDRSCGFHLHISPHNLSQERAKSWAGWMTTLARFTEDEAFKTVPLSRDNNSMCRRLKTTKHAIKERRYSSSKYDNNDRYYWLNVVEIFRQGGIRTIENRLLGNTHRFIWLQAWTALYVHTARIALDLMDDPSGLGWRIEEVNAAYKKMHMYLDSSQASGKLMVQMSHEMAKNTGLIYEPKKNQNLIKFLRCCKQLATTGNYYPVPSCRYTKEQVEQYKLGAAQQYNRDHLAALQEDNILNECLSRRPRPGDYHSRRNYEQAMEAWQARELRARQRRIRETSEIAPRHLEAEAIPDPNLAINFSELSEHNTSNIRTG